MERLPRSQIFRRDAFSLIELIIAIGVLAILVGISVGALSSRRERSRIDRAKSDLQVIQLGLEAYRARFGDYPKLPEPPIEVGGTVDSAEAYLLNALNGRIGPTGDEINNVPSMLNNSLLTFGSGELPLSGLEDNWIVDPWGEAYVYEDEPVDDEGRELFGYTLYSLGPDGVDGTDDDIIAE